jgi:Uma2 family endonuclease
MATTAVRKTLADLHALPDDGRIFELIDGDIVVAAAPGEPHLDAVMKFVFLLAPFERVHQLGKLYVAPYELRLPTGDIVEPDLFFLTKARWSMRRGSHVEGVPDLIIEVVSPSSRTRDLVVKRRIYQGAGVPEYWIADPELRVLDALTLHDGRFQPIPRVDGVVCSVVLPGLEVDVDELFAVVP